MRTYGNTILITGGGGGIGRGLAEAFHKLGNRVIVAGRREAPLRETCEANPGMNYMVMDVSDGDSIRSAAKEAIARFPELNCVINNAGIQTRQNFAEAGGVSEERFVAEIETNLTGLVRVCAALVPHLKTRPGATLIQVSSGLAFVPMARFPVYCATKTAVHSFTVSLRHQLKHAGVKVVELIPPWVATNLGGGQRPAAGPQPMPLADFVAEAMRGLSGDDDEVAVGDAKFLYGSAGTGERFVQAFARMNSRAD